MDSSMPRPSDYAYMAAQEAAGSGRSNAQRIKRLEKQVKKLKKRVKKLEKN